jgi:hypothetical protein
MERLVCSGGISAVARNRKLSEFCFEPFRRGENWSEFCFVEQNISKLSVEMSKATCIILAMFMPISEKKGRTSVQWFLK